MVPFRGVQSGFVPCPVETGHERPQMAPLLEFMARFVRDAETTSLMAPAEWCSIRNGRITMALTDMQVRSLKPADKVYKVTDERGLYLEISPSGSKLWRYKYLYMGKDKRIALGRYPEVGLAEARRKRIEARESLDNGIDPLANRKREKLIAIYKAANTFGDIAKEYLEKLVADQRAETTITKAHWLLEQLEPIAASPITELQPIDVLAALKRLEAHGKHETARRCRSFASRVFRYAVATGRGETDPTVMLRGALVAPRTTHHAALIEPKEVGELLRAIDGYSGHTVTRGPHALGYGDLCFGLVSLAECAACRVAPNQCGERSWVANFASRVVIMAVRGGPGEPLSMRRTCSCLGRIGREAANVSDGPCRVMARAPGWA